MMKLLQRALGLFAQESTWSRRPVFRSRSSVPRLERLEERLVLDGPGGVGGGSYYTYGFSVNSLDDTAVRLPRDGTGRDINGNVSLRSAIQESNAEGGDHGISFSVSGTINLQTAMDTITSNDSIQGSYDSDTRNYSVVISRSSTAGDFGLFTVGQGSSSEFDALKFMNGAGSYGGAINNIGSLTVDGCNFVNNSAKLYGGAIYNGDSGFLYLEWTYLNGNSAQNGGAIFNAADADGISGGFASLNDVQIFQNTATANGGGIYNAGYMSCYGSTSVLLNTASIKGGGIFSLGYGASLTFNDGIINGNAVGQGGGVDGGYGGGIYIGSGTASFTNDAITYNSSTWAGGAAFLDGGTTTFDTCTIQGNTVAYYGPGICYRQGSASYTVTNCNNPQGETPY